MEKMTDKIKTRLIEQEMKESYIDYAMSVIVGRALPDVRDGLKPVHRRILYTMQKLGLYSNKPFRKSAFIVGRTMGELHPHGNLAIYDALVRMAQPWSLRYPLVKSQGNFGSIDGDSPAADRYTEAKLQKMAEEMLQDIEKETIDFVDNYDGSIQEPTVLPSKIPNLLINGSSGIAVGMATNIPPYNLTEVCNAITSLIDDEDSNPEEHILGPDFPTGGYILGRNGIRLSNKTGRGRIVIRSKTKIEDKKIIISEIPYQVNKSLLIEQIAELVKNKIVEGISDLRDESDRDGIRIVIELKNNANAELILNQLYRHSPLEISFGSNFVAIVDKQPKTLTLKEMLKYFILHRKDVVEKRTKFELKKAQERLHVLEGLLIALSNIDEVIKLIKASKDASIAKSGLMEKFSLTEIQAQAILDMRLQTLTNLQTEKIKKEHDELTKLIKELQEILQDQRKIFEIIKKETLEIKDKYGDKRRTEILDIEEKVMDESLIKKEDVVITVTHSGYAKRIPLETYKQQKRGGRGIQGTTMKEEDVVEHLFVTNSHNHLLLFTSKGIVHCVKAFEIPEASRYAKGTNLVNIIRLSKDEKINSLIPIEKFSEDLFLTMCTKNGLIKKTPLKLFSKPRQGGIIAIKIKPEDSLVSVLLTDGKQNLFIATEAGRAVKFNETQVRPMGRNSSGVRGIKINRSKVIGMEYAQNSILTVTEKGYGKRTNVDDYRLINRGGKGVINIKVTEKNGKVVGIKSVNPETELMFISQNGIIIRISAKDISEIGRNTQGVRVMRISENDKLNAIAKVDNN